MDYKLVVTVSRYWHEPKILTYIDGNEISLTISMDDFVKAMVQEIDLSEIVSQIKNEIGSVRWVFKDETWDKKFDQAVQSAITQEMVSKLFDKVIPIVIGKVKEESVKVA